MDLSRDDIFRIVKLIEDSGYDEVRLEVGDFKLHVQKHADTGASSTTAPDARQLVPESPRPAAAPAAAPQPAAPASKARQAVIPEGAIVVRSPMLGTFYRAPSPGEKPFVEVGSKVGADDTLCLVEVMKLFNSIKAGASGKVVQIPAENAAMVEHGQPLLAIQPD